jgi:hypothetical protein
VQPLWPKLETSCTDYDRASGEPDRALRATAPSRAQFHQWLSGQVKGGPRPGGSLPERPAGSKYTTYGHRRYVTSLGGTMSTEDHRPQQQPVPGSGQPDYTAGPVGPTHSGYPGPPVPQQRRPWAAHRGALTALALLGTLLAGGGVGYAIGNGTGGGDDSGNRPPVAAATEDTRKGTALDPSYTPSAEQTADGVQETTPPPPVVERSATPKDFTITLKIKSKECFGSAGCNVTYEPKLTIVGPDVDENGSYEITYEIRGGEDGADVDTIELEAGQYRTVDGLAQTSSQSAKLTAVITEVETN